MPIRSRVTTVFAPELERCNVLDGFRFDEKSAVFIPR